MYRPILDKAQEMARRWFDRSKVRVMTAALILIVCMTQAYSAEEPAPSQNDVKHDDDVRRSAAVALNYSRAALHHIRQNPSKRVLYEEQEKILNHLNLNGVADEEVLKLYSSVLDEISQIQIADQERLYLKQRYRHQLSTGATAQIFALAANLATTDYVGAVRTGANSWWDYRNITLTRDQDQWKVEKSRMTAFVDKSAQFLDTSWKMARAKQIPDRWLVRNDDLDRLDTAWKEPNPTIRLRVLKRMEPFMECYPPYWYYVARTQQALGQLASSVETYQRLVKLGMGHFRKDDMLASGLANQALIQAHLELPGAAESARLALHHSTDVWEANLVCAAVLQRSGAIDDAEDAILRNLDVDLERTHSQIALLGLYCQTKQVDKLTAQLNHPHVIRDVPVPVLMACASEIGDERMTALLVGQLQSTFQAAPRINLGRDDLVLSAGPNWQLQNAAVTLQWGGKTFRKPRIAAQKDSMLISFDSVGEFGSLFGHSADKDLMTVTLAYPDFPPITLHLASKELVARSESSANSRTARYPVYRLASFEPMVRAQAPVAAAASSQQPSETAAQVISVETTEDTPPADAMLDPELVTPEIEIRGR